MEIPVSKNSTFAANSQPALCSVSAIADSDRHFFERHRKRQYRIRLAGRSEVNILQLSGLPLPPTFNGYRHFILARQVRPGFILRALFSAPAETETDLSENKCRKMAERIGGLAVGGF